MDEQNEKFTEDQIQVIKKVFVDCIHDLNELRQLNIDYYEKYPDMPDDEICVDIGNQAGADFTKQIDPILRAVFSGVVSLNNEYSELSLASRGATGYDYVFFGKEVEEKKRTIFTSKKVTDSDITFTGNNRQNTKVPKFILPVLGVDKFGFIKKTWIGIVNTNKDEWVRNADADNTSFSKFCLTPDHLTQPSYEFQQVIGGSEPKYVGKRLCKSIHYEFEEI